MDTVEKRKITKSFSRKLPLSYFTGDQEDRYATIDFFASESHTWTANEKQPTEQEVADKEDELFQNCLESVKRDIAVFAKDLADERPIDEGFKPPF